jgi:hypothetical protein
MYTQNISGTPPVPRASATGVLGNTEYTFNINIQTLIHFYYYENKGPDNECIYYFGGSLFDLWLYIYIYIYIFYSNIRVLFP